MAYKIIWTKNAKEDLKDIVFYLKEEWSEEISEKFISNLFSKLEILSEFPLLGKASEKNINIRRILISEQNFLYYKIERIKSGCWIFLIQDKTLLKMYSFKSSLLHNFHIYI